jgi:acyl-CoA thioester hydrolase
VTTDLVALGGASLTLRQEVWRGEERLFTALVVLVCLLETGKPARLPAPVRAALEGNRP